MAYTGLHNGGGGRRPPILRVCLLRILKSWSHTLIYIQLQGERVEWGGVSPTSILYFRVKICFYVRLSYIFGTTTKGRIWGWGDTLQELPSPIDFFYNKILVFPILSQITLGNGQNMKNYFLWNGQDFSDIQYIPPDSPEDQQELHPGSNYMVLHQTGMHTQLQQELQHLLPQNFLG